MTTTDNFISTFLNVVRSSFEFNPNQPETQNRYCIRNSSATQYRKTPDINIEKEKPVSEKINFLQKPNTFTIVLNSFHLKNVSIFSDSMLYFTF